MKASYSNLLPLILLFFSFGCKQDKYANLVAEEMETNIVHDSLLFDMKFGQSRKEFFDQCWNLNKNGIVKQGPNNKFVEYKLPMKTGQNTNEAITMLFYGIFNAENTMIGMDFQFAYDGWSLWNQKMQSNNLVPVVKDSLKKWYPGNDFMELTVKNDTTHYFVKVDGNRRITINPVDDNRIVKAQIDDLRYILEK